MKVLVFLSWSAGFCNTCIYKYFKWIDKSEKIQNCDVSCLSLFTFSLKLTVTGLRGRHRFPSFLFSAWTRAEAQLVIYLAPRGARQAAQARNKWVLTALQATKIFQEFWKNQWNIQEDARWYVFSRTHQDFKRSS